MLRARQFRTTIERLGPAYVKVAQAISTRVDLLTPAYYSQIQLLQDRVPPFACETAKEVMAKVRGSRFDELRHGDTELYFFACTPLVDM